MKSSALIVTFNRLEKLKQCWATTSALPFEEIIIVDNASTDETQPWLNSIEDSRLHVIRATQNDGGAGGFRLGAEYIASKIDTDWVFMFDDDAYPDSELLTRFVDLAQRSDYAAYCSRVLDKQGALCKMNVPFSKMPTSLLQTLDYITEPGRYTPAEHKPADVVTLSFVGAIIRKDVLAANIEYIWPELFIYYDDLYFSYRLSQQGYRFRYSPELMFLHDVPASQGGITPPWKVYYLVRNLLLSRMLFEKHERPYSLGAIVLRIAKYLLSFTSQGRKGEYIKYVVRGIVDGISRKNGKQH
ncbi:glycosyltransferase [Serratia marcescens]|uniref:glycosyltransferase n=1 Tax=Serratia TaxID=613 RepID=UPI0018D6A454|nr:glycosyltransferase [Serratia marcescens]ELQ9308064.1 glycosyltransferase [Serratia marcescens]ELQ9437849.1 glycosyltransferase [Serratia marcescens]ELT5558186.1 glycosyltransferase [Serratia marcescens]MBH2585069.1 glycosyltransferase [Serratia marcescens]MBH3257982.1 glycosyltransferase [Serratia marcescens]